MSPRVPKSRQRWVKLNLRETNFLRKQQGNQSNSLEISPILDSNDFIYTMVMMARVYLFFAEDI
jgi:hypothetical protein